MMLVLRNKFVPLVMATGVILTGLFAETATAADSLFFGGFESGTFSGWNNPVGPNFSISGGTCRSGPDSNVSAVKISGDQAPHGQLLQKSVSTAGYENI